MPVLETGTEMGELVAEKPPYNPAENPYNPDENQHTLQRPEWRAVCSPARIRWEKQPGYFLSAWLLRGPLELELSFSPRTVL